MTLVVAGHSLQKGAFSKTSNYVNGLFAASDSNITSDGTVLVSGFKKVIEVPVRVKALNFCGDYLNGYMGYRYEGGGFIAFAGSTLVAQHIINSIINHLGELYPTFVAGEYKLAMSCETEWHLENREYFDDMLLDKDLNPLLTASYLAGVVSHSIQAVLNSAKKHEGMKKKFSELQAEFIFGIQCPAQKSFNLYQYEILSDENGGAVVNQIDVPQGDLAVIGLKTEYAVTAQACYTNAIKSGERTAKALHKFVASSITDKNEIGIFSIGKPCGLYEYGGLRLEKVSVIT
jgi:hypothetical protein